MNPRAYHSTYRSAFTLIELLVVIGIIGVAVGGIGLALGTGNKGVALQNAQGTLTSVLSGARAQAAITQASAAIFVNADPDSDNFLREIRIAVYTKFGADDKWMIRGEPIILPKGIYLVPKAGVFTDPDEVDFVGNWSSGSWTLHSTAYDNTDVNLVDEEGNDISAEVYNELCTFSPRGITTAGKVVVSPGEREADGTIQFATPDFVRGAKMSRYGVPTFLSDVEAFK